MTKYQAKVKKLLGDETAELMGAIIRDARADEVVFMVDEPCGHCYTHEYFEENCTYFYGKLWSLLRDATPSQSQDLVEEVSKLRTLFQASTTLQEHLLETALDLLQPSEVVEAEE